MACVLLWRLQSPSVTERMHVCYMKTTGVPHGSMRSPLIFFLYTHSLGDIRSSQGFSYHCYADNTRLILSSPPGDSQISARISLWLNVTTSWMHHLKLNRSKTELHPQDLTWSSLLEMLLSFPFKKQVLKANVFALSWNWTCLTQAALCLMSITLFLRCVFDVHSYSDQAFTGPLVLPSHIIFHLSVCECKEKQMFVV